MHQDEKQPLLTPLSMGQLTLPNRVVMAPMTRNRAENKDLVPVDIMATYYAQRASAGLLITEGSQVSAMGVGYMNTPGIHSESQVEGWKKVTRAVHEKGGRIFLQLGQQAHAAVGGDAVAVQDDLHPGVLLIEEHGTESVVVQHDADTAATQIARAGHPQAHSRGAHRGRRQHQRGQGEAEQSRQPRTADG